MHVSPATFPHASVTSAKRAFTLVELLTVIAIIGVLAGILIPTVAAVRNTARTAQCASNLRQIGMASILFAEDHKGKFTSGRLYNSTEDAEPGLKEYFDGNKNHSVFTCPTLAHYGVVHTYSQVTTTSSRTQFGQNVLVYRHKVEHPTRTAWIMDGKWDAANKWFNSVIHPTADCTDGLLFPHKDRQNVLFVDGHVEQVALSRLADQYALIWRGRM
ncbi:type II secretion system protein [Opitutaceae bacterium TAV4]|nr:type II secretion system protein [Opitutaceae bacterium TAV4]RRK02057.1 type II secretion system protein [Opitutaceae bacterium TAV3]